MVLMTEYPIRSKEVTIWALARQNPDFSAFYAEYQEQITLTEPLPTDFLDGVIAVVEEDPTLAPVAKRYLENAQAAATFGGPGMPEAGVLIAALFLLSTHIKFHRTKDGKWEFLLEHRASDNAILKKIAQILSGLFKK